MNDRARTPIAVFTYNRPLHTQRALAALARCGRLEECSLYIYCDGANNIAAAKDVASVREVARDWAARLGAEVVERTENLGLARSVVAGVTELCDRFSRVIVLEDDLVVSPDFLNFMLQSLDKYEHEPSVYQVGGHMHPIDYHPQTDAFLLPRIESWGWATWARAWRAFDWNATEVSSLFSDKQTRYRFDLGGSYPYVRMLRERLAGKNDSWGILWYWSVFRADGLVVYPRTSLVWNGGFDGSGVHCAGTEVYRDDAPSALRAPVLPAHVAFPSSVATDDVAYRRLVSYFNSQKPALVKRVLYYFSAKIPGMRRFKRLVARSIGDV
jgi:hypothetical protein